MVSRMIFVLLLATVAQLSIAQDFVTYQREDLAQAQAVIDRATECRKEIAIAWFGHELPTWDEPCVITWKITNSLGAGRTEYDRSGRRPRSMRMHIDSTWWNLMNDVIPHEVFHLLIRDHLGFTVPRWMDEGGASTNESDIAITRHEEMLRRFFIQRRVPPLNRMMLMRQYPSDMMPFYAEGVSVSRWLINKGGPGKWLSLAREHNESKSWTASFKTVYGYDSLESIQNDWVDWLNQGCPDISSAETVLKPIPRSQAPYRPMIRGDQSACGTTGCDPRSQPAISQGSLGRQGAPGIAGPTGPPGPAGEDGTITEEQLRAIIAQLKADPALRGGRGPTGETGLSGEHSGNRRVILVDGVTNDVLDDETYGPDEPIVITSGYDGRRRVVIVNGATNKIIDDEMYGPGEPIVIDVQSIINAAKKQ